MVDPCRFDFNTLLSADVSSILARLIFIIFYDIQMRIKKKPIQKKHFNNFVALTNTYKKLSFMAIIIISLLLLLLLFVLVVFIFFITNYYSFLEAYQSFRSSFR